MSQNSNSTSTPLPTARKSRRASQRNRPVLVSSTSQGVQEIQGSQIETLEPEISNELAHTEPLTETSVITEIPAVPAKARRAARLPSFFSKVEKTVEEPETSQEEIVKARLARAQKTTTKADATPVASETKKHDGKPTRTANETEATARPKSPFKTRHFIGMMIYLLGAEFLLPLEASFIQKAGLENVYARFSLFNIPMVITTSVLLNLATLVILLLILVKLDLLPKSMGGRTTATARAQQQRRDQQAVAQRQPQTLRQGVKGEDDDLYYAYRNNQRREKKH